MKTQFLAIAVLAALSLTAACGQPRFSLPAQNSANLPSSNTTTGPLPIQNPSPVPSPSPVAGSNVMAVTVGQCGVNGYANEPCASVTLCTPGMQTCQTIPDLLIDTGSYGLRIFASAISIKLNAETSGGEPLGECAFFGSANTWGSVQTADVQLGSETAPNVPIQVLDTKFASIPATCTTPLADPASAGFNGILGVGLFIQDCGPTCVSNPNNFMYYACAGTRCTNVTVALASQVSNPVAYLPKDNNGVILSFPAVGPVGAPSISGNLIFGIGTETDNIPGQVTVFPADANGNFTTTFNGQTFTDASFIDSGSNGLFFPTPANLKICASPFTGFFCPASLTSFSAVQQGAAGTPQKTVSFQIDNAMILIDGGSLVLNDLGGNLTGGFDWGLPFFLGRTVYVGIGGQISTLGPGPYWAY